MLHQTTNSENDRSIWFPVKRYGWGWGLPVAWQGWLVLAVWLAIVVSVVPVLATRTWVGFGAFVLFMAGLLVGICYAKGEKPRWRWGK